MSTHTIRLVLNGSRQEHEVPAELLLIDLIRDRCGLTGTKLGCSVGVVAPAAYSSTECSSPRASCRRCTSMAAPSVLPGTGYGTLTCYVSVVGWSG